MFGDYLFLPVALTKPMIDNWEREFVGISLQKFKKHKQKLRIPSAETAGAPTTIAKIDSTSKIAIAVFMRVGTHEFLSIIGGK